MLNNAVIEEIQKLNHKTMVEGFQAIVSLNPKITETVSLDLKAIIKRNTLKVTIEQNNLITVLDRRELKAKIIREN